MTPLGFAAGRPRRYTCGAGLAPDSRQFAHLFSFEGLEPIADFGSAELTGPAVPGQGRIEIAAHTA